MFRKIHKRLDKIESWIKRETEVRVTLLMRLYAVEGKTKMTAIEGQGFPGERLVCYQINDALCMLLDYLNVKIVHTEETTKIAKTTAKETNDE